MQRILTRLALAIAVTAFMAGCASKNYVRTEIGSAEARIGERVDTVESQVEANQSRLDSQEARVEAQASELSEASQTAREALDRAVAAGKLAEGKLLYETVLTDDQVHFAVDQFALSPEAEAALDTFAERLKEENANVFVEIQGHTDATGSEAYNLRLGERRAEAVRRYLNLEHGLPLHRMSVISYGESAPVADNGTREGRSQNRRVVLVVLR